MLFERHSMSRPDLELASSWVEGSASCRGWDRAVSWGKTCQPRESQVELVA